MGRKSYRKYAVIVMVMLMAVMTVMLSGCGKSYEYTSGDVEWLSTYKEKSSDTEAKTVKDTFYYSDDWFADDPGSENSELALASMQLTAACVSDEDDGMGAEFLRSMGFEEVGFSDFESDDPDDCNYTWARKTAGDRTIVAVAIQSTSTDPGIKNK